jgi:hypothetical protein
MVTTSIKMHTYRYTLSLEGNLEAFNITYHIYHPKPFRMESFTISILLTFEPTYSDAKGWYPYILKS